MLAVVAEDVGRLELRQRPEPPQPGAGEVMIRPEAVGICGSDLHFIAGELSAQAGGGGYPRVLGHEVGARIVALGDGCRPELRVGQRVALWPLEACGRCYPCRVGRDNACERFSLIGVHRDGGLQELLVVPEGQVYPIRSDDPAVAALAEPLSIGVRAVNRAAVRAGERLVVLGAGPIGHSVCLVARERGAEVLLVDRQPSRLEGAEALGASTLRWRGCEPTVNAAREWAGADGPPVVVDATGAPEAVRAMVEMVATAGRAIQVGMSRAEVTFRLGLLTEKELDLRGVSCCNGEEFAEAVAIAERNAASLQRLVSHRFALADGPDALRFAAEHPEQAMKVVIGG